MTRTGYSALKELMQLKGVYGGDASRRKHGMLEVLAREPLARGRDVLALHEALCFLRAYPDDKRVLGRVEEMLEAFSRRSDLRRFRRHLEDTGIAGTHISFPFFWFTAEWLARRWPKCVFIDWSAFEKRSELLDLLHLLLPFSETPALDSLIYSPRKWIEHLKGTDETDACFLIRRFKKLAGDSFSRETFYERLNIPVRLKAGAETPSRTLAHWPVKRVHFQTGDFSTSKDLRGQIRACRVRVSPVSAHDGRKLIDLARESMITRSRDLDAFEHASDKDVCLVDCGDGLQFACFGVKPERRLLLDAVYGCLTIKNGVPIGYFLVGALFHSAEVAFNVFETFRGAESGLVYARALAMVRRLFRSDTFVVPPYQLGHNNLEALESGAWWFYYKRGFRPRDAGVLKLLSGERKKMRKNPRYRTDLRTLNRLSSENMYLRLGGRSGPNIGTIDAGNIGMAISGLLSRRFGAEREQGIRTLAREAAGLLGLRSLRGFTRVERLAWDRWSPLVLALDGVETWSLAERRALAEVIRAKGGVRETEFVRKFDRHRKLQAAVVRLSRQEAP